MGEWSVGSDGHLTPGSATLDVGSSSAAVRSMYTQDVNFVTSGGTFSAMSILSNTLTSSSLRFDLTASSNQTVSSSTATGSKGLVFYDSNYIYVCVETNTWVRIAIGTSW